MWPSTRSRSGAPMAVGRGVNMGRSKVDAAGSGRIQKQQVVDELLSAKPGPPRDRAGRFIKGDSLVEVAGPVPVLQKHVAAVDMDLQDATKDEEQDSSAGTEVSGLVTSSSDSDCDAVEGGKSVEAGDHFSVLSKPDGGLLADQVFDHMPQSGPAVHGEKMGGDSSTRVSEKGVGAAQQAPWVNLFKDNRNLGKGIKLEEWEVDGDLVMLEEDDVDVVEEAWGYCLVGLFAGKFPGMAAVRKLREGWKVNCTHWRHRSGWFVFKFQSEEDRRQVLEGGPYFAYGSNLILKILPRCFRFEGEDVSSVPIWIQLPGLPLDCWNARALGKIVSKVGKPISSDKMTLTKERLSFARVLVEVDASTDIISDVEVRLPTGVVYQQSVIPEFIPKFCKKCKSFGHVEGECGKDSVGTKYQACVAKRKLRTGGGSVSSIGVNKGGRAS